MKVHPSSRQSFSPPPHRWESIFDELFHSRRILQTWFDPITFLALRYNPIVRHAILTDVRWNRTYPGQGMPDAIYGIPLIEDPTLPANPGYAIDYTLM